MNYYNDIDPLSCAWLHQLIADGLIPPGEVDQRSIADVWPVDLLGFTQCHFFAGIGGWAHALTLAGWPEDRPVWTGSCPCQPFSAAGKRRGTADPRHLWPQFFRLISQCQPASVFGEQVASSDGREWLAGVRSDLETVGYEVGAADLCAAGVGAPHIRQRLYWVANADQRQRDGYTRGGEQQVHHEDLRSGGLAHPQHDDGGSNEPGWSKEGREVDGRFGGLGNPDDTRPQGRHERGDCAGQLSAWASSVALSCTDGRARRIEPGTFPLAHGVSGRMGLLRGYGNAIVPQVAAQFVRAAEEARYV